jgi:hypothetical protein
MNILDLADLNVKALRATHPAFAGTKLLARGGFCAVFTMPDPARVLKLTTDKQHVCYLTDGIAPQGEHKPQVLVEHDIDTETKNGLNLYLLEVERLQKIQAGSPAKKLATRMMRFYKEHRRLPQGLADIEGMTPSLAQFLQDLTWFVTNYEARLDLKMDNFMQRADGTLVMSDPVFDHLLQEREFQRLRRKNDLLRAQAGYYAGYPAYA